MAKRRIDASDIVVATAEVADRQGRSAVTMGDVASSLGVATSALYHHVGGLDELQFLLAVHATEWLADELRDALVATAGPDAVEAIARTYRSYADRCPGRFEAAMTPPVGTDRADELSAAHRRIVDLFTEVARSVGFEGEPAVHWGRLLRSAIHGFVAIEAIDGFVHETDRDATFDQLIDATNEALVA